MTDVQRRVLSDVTSHLWVDRQPEVEMKRLEIPGLCRVRRRDHEIADHRKGRKSVGGYERIDQRPRLAESLRDGPEPPRDVGEPLIGQRCSMSLHPHIVAEQRRSSRKPAGPLSKRQNASERDPASGVSSCLSPDASVSGPLVRALAVTRKQEAVVPLGYGSPTPRGRQ